MYKEIENSFNVDDHGFEGNYFGYVVSVSEENLKNWLEKMIDEPELVCDAISRQTDEIFILKNINIDNEYQGMGFGKEVLEQAMEKADAPTLLLCDLEESQREGMELESFYQSQGFERILEVDRMPIMASEDVALEIKEELLPFQDKIYVQEWLNAASMNDLDFKNQKEDMSRFETHVKEMNSYGTDDDRERVDVIKGLIQDGANPWPVYVEEKDNFVMEGRHKVVAFYELGFKEIDVCRVSLKSEYEPEPEPEPVKEKKQSRKRNRP